MLADIERQAGSPALAARLQRFATRPQLIAKRGFPRYPNFIEGTPGVACADTDNPDSYAAWSAAAAASDASGYFGRPWIWLSSLCAEWPHADADRYTGPFDRATANPVLVVGTRFDPATRYEGALTVARLLPNSTLLTVDGWGHTSLFLSGCADDAVSRYLTGPERFDDDTVCKQDAIPFSAP